jgi:hypothetical protein
MDQHLAIGQVFVGIDVAKDRLDVHLSPSGKAFAVARDHAGLEQLVARLDQTTPALVVLDIDLAPRTREGELRDRVALHQGRFVPVIHKSRADSTMSVKMPPRIWSTRGHRRFARRPGRRRRAV